MSISADALKSQYERAMERNAAKLAVIQAMPAEDIYEDGQVLRIKRTFGSDKVYIYAAVRIEGAWWLSGRRYVRYGSDKYERAMEQPLSWEQLVVWLVDSGDPQVLSVEELAVNNEVI